MKQKLQAGRFASQLLDWYDLHGRRDLPWQLDRNDYRVWVSEIMLQQTQVTTVVGYYQRFMQQFPNLQTLAAAELDQVMMLWEGLGYYSRARNLHAAAGLCMEQHGGTLPQDLEQLCALPGIGRSTAGAIISLAWDRPVTILDGNVKRVLARYHALSGWPGRSAVSRKLWQLAEAHLPASRGADFSQASMDLGALVCLPKAPDCPACPVSTDCKAYARGTQQMYPEKKKPVASPERLCVLILVVDEQGRLLMEKRPPSGIWGGLWSLPMYDSIERAEYSLGQLDSIRWVAPFVHVFTHFRLHASPVVARHSADNTNIKDSIEEHWVNATKASALGMPKPIRILVSDFFTGQLKWQEPSTV